MLAIDSVQVLRFRMRSINMIKALFILNIKKMNIWKIRSKCITFMGIDHIYCTCICNCFQVEVADLLKSSLNRDVKFDNICGVPYTALPIATVSYF